MIDRNHAPSGKKVERVTGDEALAFMRLMWALDHALQRASKRMHKVAGVTGPQRLAIRMVGRFPAVSATELAALLHVDPSTLTGILGRIERQGLVCRRRDARDGRRWQLGLTARGRSLDALRHGTVEQAVREMMREARPQDLKATQRVLEILNKRLERRENEFHWGGANHERV